MSSNWPSTIAAQAADTGLPPGKAAAILVFFGLVGVVSALGLFASRETLESLSGWIGTKNPLVARLACGFGALVGLVIAAAAVLQLLGKL